MPTPSTQVVLKVCETALSLPRGHAKCIVHAL